MAIAGLDKPADMFADDIDVLERLPTNEAAADVYRSCRLKHHPSG
jgi:hypothetical protein